MAEESKAGPGNIAPKAVGAVNPPSQPGAVTTPASASVPLFGGNRGGRRRADGLPPGSDAAKEADRKKDAERKRSERKPAAAVAQPPPLPSATSPAPGALAPAPGSPGANGAAPAGETPIPWDPAVLEPMVIEAVELTEKSRIQKFYDLATAGQLPPPVCQRVARDAAYTPAFKGSLVKSAPRAMAKLLNLTGISGKYSDEAMTGVALLALFLQGRRLESKLEQLIEQAKKAREAAEQKKSNVQPETK